MKKLILFAFMAIYATMAVAQVNPKPGYIITNEGDTIHGTLDLRTNSINTSQCTFKADGQNAYKTFHPGEIEEYRFDDGKYYVTRNFEIGGITNLYFGEYIVQGIASVYKVVANNNEYLFVVNDEGETVCVKADNESDMNSSQRIVAQNNLKNLFRKSPNTASALDDRSTAVSERNIVEMVCNYHKDLCTDGSNCIVYKQKKSADQDKIRFMASAGFAQKLGDWNSSDAAGFTVAAGVEVALPRVAQNFYVEAGARYTRFACMDWESHFSENIVTAEAGVAYKVPFAKIFNWTVRGGLNVDFCNVQSNRKGDYPHGTYTWKGGWGGPLNIIYIGTGFGVDILGHEVFVDVRYRGNKFNNLGEGTLLLSAGVKI